ncbi:hypothetical protein BDR03DRAFT_1009933 [Suillus americanus]|nr:hypothetical protein BDR03DRAFT_1009933 [Suillus americanus]
MDSIPSFWNNSILTLRRKLTAPVTSTTMRSRWLNSFSTRKQCSYAVPTLIGSRLPTVTSRADDERGYESSDSDSKIEDSQTQPHSAVHPANIAPMTDPCLVHSLAKNPAYPQQSIQHLVTTHGATMFLQAFKSFLQKHIPHNKIVPGPQDRFDVFRQVVIVAPSNPQANDSQKRWCI